MALFLALDWWHFGKATVGLPIELSDSGQRSSLDRYQEGHIVNDEAVQVPELALMFRELMAAVKAPLRII